MPARHLRTSSTTLRLTIALLASVAVLGAVLMIPGGGSEPEAAPDPTTSHTPEPPTPPPAPARQNVYTCPAYSGIDRANPVANLYKDTFKWGTTPPTKVGDGKGNINWRMNPANNPSWYMWLHSLRWLGQGITAAAAGRQGRAAAGQHDHARLGQGQPVLVEVRCRRLRVDDAPHQRPDLSAAGGAVGAACGATAVDVRLAGQGADGACVVPAEELQRRLEPRHRREPGVVRDRMHAAAQRS